VSSEFRFVNAGEVFESSVGRQGFMPGGILCPPVLGVNYFFKPIDDAVPSTSHGSDVKIGPALTTAFAYCLLCATSVSSGLGGYFC
jgi:hypothetical protein